MKIVFSFWLVKDRCLKMNSLIPFCLSRGRKAQKDGKISYADFVWFLISEEDKKTPTR